MSDDTERTSERTCADCIDFAPITCDGEQTGRGLCAVDGELVRSDNPQCSNAPARHGGTRCGEIAGCRSLQGDVCRRDRM